MIYKEDYKPGDEESDGEKNMNPLDKKKALLNKKEWRLLKGLFIQH